MDINDIMSAGGAGKEMVKQIGELAKEPVTNLLNPPAKTIGQRLSDIVDLVFTPVELAKIYKDHSVEKLKKSLSDKIAKIPEHKRIAPPLNVVGPALEAAKYHIEDEKLREMFAELIANAMNADKINLTHPAFVEVIKQLSPLDAKLISLFIMHNTYPACDIQELHSDGKITPYNLTLFDFKDKGSIFQREEQIRLTSSLDNARRLGIIHKNTAILELNYDYNLFKTNFMYVVSEQMIQKDSTLRLIKSRIELTDFGRSFVNCCLTNSEIGDNDKT